MILPVHITTHTNTQPVIRNSRLAGRAGRENPTARGKERRQHVFVKDKAQLCSAAAFREHSASKRAVKTNWSHQQRNKCIFYLFNGYLHADVTEVSKLNIAVHVSVLYLKHNP